MQNTRCDKRFAAYITSTLLFSNNGRPRPEENEEGVVPVLRGYGCNCAVVTSRSVSGAKTEMRARHIDNLDIRSP